MVEEPLNVRFGWNQLATPNLVNREGLPASPFTSAK
jgi:sialate O-acetylesterase